MLCMTHLLAVPTTKITWSRDGFEFDTSGVRGTSFKCPFCRKEATLSDCRPPGDFYLGMFNAPSYQVAPNYPKFGTLALAIVDALETPLVREKCDNCDTLVDDIVAHSEVCERVMCDVCEVPHRDCLSYLLSRDHGAVMRAYEIVNKLDFGHALSHQRDQLEN